MIENLIILSAELIDKEMQVYFGKLPSCMIPFNGRPVIDYIYHENYNHYKKIYILVSKEANYVKNYLDHSQQNIEIIFTPKSNNLLESLKFALNTIRNHGETTIIFGDTYLPYMSFLLKNKDALIYSRSTESLRWTIGEVKDHKLRIYDKKKLDKDKLHNILIGVFNILRPKKLLNIIETLSDHKIGFYDVLKEYFNQHEFHFLETKAWIDYGHLDKYFEQKNIVASRHFNSLDVNLKEKSVIKTSSHTNKLIKEIEWLVNLPKELKEFIPKVYHYSLDKDKVFVEMEYFDFLTVHEAYVFGNLPIEKWQTILTQIKQIINKFRFFQVNIDKNTIRKNLKEMYLLKTINRLKMFKEQGLFNFSEPMIINQIQYPSLNDHITYLKSIVEKELLSDDMKFHIIHGDFCFSNILFSPDNTVIKLIDPRGTFGKIDSYGDQRYEWAKLAHSIEGNYDFIISDKYSLVKNENNISYKTHHLNVHEQIKDYFYSDIIPSEDIKKVKLIQSLLFFSMLPLHNDHTNRQCIMLCKALELINPYIK